VDNSVGKYLFSYDPLGRRVKKVIESPSGTVLETYGYHYDGSEVAVEYQPTTTWTYYLGLGIDQPVMRVSGTTKQWYYANAQGSISAVADNSGNVLEQYEYNAQGHVNIANASGTVETGTLIDNEILYTGRSYDAETGNYFYRARYYNPYLGRFISRDPLSGAEFSQGTNLYAYCQNNYLNLSDPTGMWTLSFGVSYNVQLGSSNWQGSMGLVVDTSGNVAAYNTQGAGGGAGANTSFGVTADVTNAPTVTDISGLGVNASETTNAGEGAGANVNAGTYTDANGQTQVYTGAGVTESVGAGADVSVDLTNTHITPLLGPATNPVTPTPPPAPTPPPLAGGGSHSSCHQSS
jgi:RHS repeat-associated protein